MSLLLAVVTPEGDAWLSPLGTVRRRLVPGAEADQVHPEVASALRAGLGNDLSALPPRARRARIIISPTFQRHYLPDVLAVVCRQAKIAFAADDLLNTRRQPYPWLLTDQASYELPAAIDQVARTFVHRFTFRQGVLRARTAVRGLDLFLEPDERLFHDLRGFRPRGPHPRLATWVDFGNLPDEQMSVIRLQGSDLLGDGSLISEVMAARFWLRGYGGLDNEQRTKANAGSVNLRDLPAARQHPFWILLNVGPEAQGVDARPDSLQIRRQPADPNQLGVRVIFTLRGTQTRQELSHVVRAASE